LLPVRAARGSRQQHGNGLSALPFPTAHRHSSSEFRIFEPGPQLDNDVHQPDNQTRRRRSQFAFVRNYAREGPYSHSIINELAKLLIRIALSATARTFTVIFTVNLSGTSIGADFQAVRPKLTFRDLSASIDSRDNLEHDPHAGWCGRGPISDDRPLSRFWCSRHLALRHLAERDKPGE
jgi:hypothetical protein